MEILFDDQKKIAIPTHKIKKKNTEKHHKT